MPYSFTITGLCGGKAKIKIICILPLVFCSLLAMASNGFARSYYVKPDGNDTHDGTSDRTAWRTLDKVNSFGFSTGDDVYFKSEGTWRGKPLTVDWAGSPSDRAIVGAYYIENGKEIHGAIGTRPIIDGNNKVPSNTYNGLIDVQTPYVRIENIIVQGSNGEGIDFRDRGDNGWVNNCLVRDAWRRGVDFSDVDNGVLEHSEITNVDNFGNGAMVRGVRSNGTIIRYNHIHESAGWSEAVNALHSDNMQIIGNVIYDTWANGIYLDHAVAPIVKYNVVYYTRNKKYWRKPNMPFFGIWIADEKSQGTHHLGRDQVIMYNFIASTGSNFKLSRNSTTNAALVNAKVIGNTFVEAISEDGSAVAIDIQDSPRHSNSIFKNNIILQTNGTIASVPKTAGIEFDSNLWSRQPEADARGPNDPPYAVPRLKKTSGWTNLSAGSLTGKEFALQAGSPAIGAGQKLGEAYAAIPDVDLSSLPEKIVLKTQSSLWDIGADVFDPYNQSLSAPRAPTIIRTGSAN